MHDERRGQYMFDTGKKTKIGEIVLIGLVVMIYIGLGYLRINPPVALFEPINLKMTEKYNPSQKDVLKYPIETLTTEEYIKRCVIETFGETNKQGEPKLSQVGDGNNHHAIYIQMDAYDGTFDLQRQAQEESVKLYKKLYTLYPEKYSKELFGIVVYCEVPQDNGATTDCEIMFTWFDEKTLAALNLDALAPENLPDQVYRYYDSPSFENHQNIQKD